jgi:hypothetical protein
MVLSRTIIQVWNNKKGTREDPFHVVRFDTIQLLASRLQLADCRGHVLH